MILESDFDKYNNKSGKFGNLIESIKRKDIGTVDHLWTPWRMKYVEEAASEEGCVFCKAQAIPDGLDNLIFTRGAHVFMILNRYPYTSGHIMCVPFAHVDRLEALSAETRAEMMEMLNRATSMLQKVYEPEGINVGMNLGLVAGAGVADHLHMHIVPRWAGDTSFMSVVGQTRVLPEALADTYQRVKEGWESAK